MLNKKRNNITCKAPGITVEQLRYLSEVWQEPSKSACIIRAIDIVARYEGKGKITKEKKGE